MMKHTIQNRCLLSKSWSITSIKSFMRKRFVQRKTSLEFFLFQGSTLLFNFPNKDIEQVIEMLSNIRKNEATRGLTILREKTRGAEKQKMTKKWQSRQKTTFEYLMYLNFLSGRSYRDLTQNPVMPWIWSKFNLNTLNLQDQTIYRDLSKTMGALGSSDRAEEFRKKYEQCDHFNPVPQYNFGTHYSSPAVIFQFLLRVKPYTTGAWTLQAQRFDIPDRLFFSLVETYKNVTEEMSDVRELIPEFFTLPEMFLNLEKHDFGLMQSKERVHNVILPNWSQQDPYKFVVAHRKGLEGECVSKSVNNWIDLIFGYKQRGKEAADNLNAFYYLTYEDEFDIDKVEDEKERSSYETQIFHFGQCPSQIFTIPHPARKAALPENLSIDSQVQLQFFRNNRKEDIQSNISPPELYKFTSLKPKSVIQMCFVEQDKLMIIKKNGEVSLIKLAPSGGENYPFKKQILWEKQIENNTPKPDKVYSIDQSCAFRIPPSVFLQKGKLLLCGGWWGGRLNLIKIETEECVREFKQVHESTITALDFSQEWNLLATGSKSGDVCLIKMCSDLQNFANIQQFFDHQSEVTCVQFSYELRVLLTSSLDGTINMYNAFNYKLVRQYHHPNRLPIHKVNISCRPLHSIIFFSERDCTFYSYSINGQLLATNLEQSSAIISPMIISDSHANHILVYFNFQTQKLTGLNTPFLEERFQVWKPHDFSNALSFIPSLDKKFFVCGSQDGTIYFITDPRSIEEHVYKALNQFV